MDILKNYARYAQRGQLRVLLGTMIALAGADGLISRYLITHGFAYEGNPFMQVWINQEMLLSLKIGGSFLAAFVLWRTHKRMPRASFSITLFFVAFYTMLNLWSLLIFFSKL